LWLVLQRGGAGQRWLALRSAARWQRGSSALRRAPDEETGGCGRRQRG
jgi:hypothetical protein